jgi:hypothetical protein
MEELKNGDWVKFTDERGKNHIGQMTTEENFIFYCCGSAYRICCLGIYNVWKPRKASFEEAMIIRMGG